MIMARDMHDGQMRRSGEPYFTHPVAVAAILTEQQLDDATIITALLHDTIEDTKSTYADIAGNFGHEVAELVDGVTKLTNLQLSSTETQQAENFRKLFMAMSKDLRVILVKLADRLHNMRTIKSLTADKQAQKARETMEIFAPLAGRMGMQWMREELEDLSFRVLNPEARNSIIRRFITLQRETGDVIQKITNDIRSELDKRRDRGRCLRPGQEALFDLAQDGGERPGLLAALRHLRLPHHHRVGSRLLPRPRGHPPTLERGAGPVQGLYLAAEVERLPLDPYHRLGPRRQARRGPDPHPPDARGRRGRGRRALVLPRWRPGREPVCRRSGEMARLADRTVRDRRGPRGFPRGGEAGDVPDQVFCFTPKGEVVKLPRGATPLDYAYSIHTRIGHSCAGAKVDGIRVPLWTRLKNGQSVEIITAEGQTPQATWIDIVVTGRAKSAIRRSLREENRERYVKLGQELARLAFERIGKKATDKALATAARQLGLPSGEELLARIGSAELAMRDVIRGLYPELSREDAQVETVRSVIGLPADQTFRRARCCHPVPGERIVGITYRGQGVVIHAIDCEVLADYEAEPNRWVDLHWAEGKHPPIHTVPIELTIVNDAGVLGRICSLIGEQKANISDLHFLDKKPDFYRLIVEVDLRDTEHLHAVMLALEADSDVASLARHRDPTQKPSSVM